MTAFEDKRASRRYVAIASIAVVAFTAVLIWLAFSLLRPTPPRSVTMATDPQGSFSAELAKHYRESLARNGIELKLVPTAGAVESLSRLQDPKSNISIGIIPSGIATQRDSSDLVSLGTLFYEPLWFFVRGRAVDSYDQLRGLRISIGPEGSAAHAFSMEFFSRVGIIDQKSAELFSNTREETIQKLHRGELNGAVILDPWESPFVHELLTTEKLDLQSILRADAFVALYPYLNKLVLPAGVADLAENRPPVDVLLLAPKASLVVRRTLHPAIQYLLLEAAEEIHSAPGVFTKQASFQRPNQSTYR